MFLSETQIVLYLYGSCMYSLLFFNHLQQKIKHIFIECYNKLRLEWTIKYTTDLSIATFCSSESWGIYSNSIDMQIQWQY